MSKTWRKVLEEENPDRDLVDAIGEMLKAVDGIDIDVDEFDNSNLEWEDKDG